MDQYRQGTPTSRTGAAQPAAAICSGSPLNRLGRGSVCGQNQEQIRTWSSPRSARLTGVRVPQGIPRCHPQRYASSLCASGVRSAGCACSAAKALSATPTTCTWLKSAATGAPWLQSPPGRPQSCPKSLVFSATAKGTGAHASRAPTKPALFSHVCLVCPVS